MKVAESVVCIYEQMSEYRGTFGQFESSANRLAIVAPITLCLVIGLLMMALGSARDAAAIFTGVPMALTGGVLALLFWGIPFAISAAAASLLCPESRCSTDSSWWHSSETCEMKVASSKRPSSKGRLRGMTMRAGRVERGGGMRPWESA